MASSEVIPGTPDGSVNSSSLHKEGPVLCLLNKRIRALRKKYNRILQIEENKSQGKVINKEQEEVLCSKTGIAVLIDELEKLKQPLSNALKEEIAEREREFMDSVPKRPDEDGGSANDKEYSSANDKEHSSANDEGLDNENSDGKGIMANGCFEETRKDCGESSAMDTEAPDLIAVADLLKILYFAKLFNVYSLNRLASIMWTKTHERISCLSYDYVTEDATDHLREEDLDALSMVGSFMTSRPPHATISHKDALQICVHHARQWLCNSDQPIHPNSTISYSNLRERLNRILSSDYFITTPELKTISRETAAAAATAAGQYVPEIFMHHSSAEDELLQLEHVSNYIQQQALDFVVSEANKYGLRLILSLANNYEDFGGKAQYVQWARNAGQNLNSEDDFFTNPTVKGYYKNHIKTVLTRVNSITGVAYKDDTTIFAWELMNEPRCESDPSGGTIQGWIEEMASHVKSIDGNHLLEAGLEGFYGESKKEINPSSYSVGTDFITHNQITGLDFATVHSYPDIWLAGSDEETQQSFMQSWIESHLEDGSRVLKKPVLFAEFGKSSKKPGFNNGQRDNLFGMIYKKIYFSASRGGAGGGAMFWQLMAEGMSSYGDGYEVVLSENPSTASVISAQSHILDELTRLLTSQG